MSSTSAAEVVKEGWLYKRGEHFKTWRPRYFILKTDGSLVGYKSRPTADELVEKCNNFTIKGCQIMSVDLPRPFTFIIRGLQWTCVIERMFNVEADEVRTDWINAIRGVATKLEEADRIAAQRIMMDPSIELAASAEEELMNVKFSLQGERTGRVSGKRKITLENFEFLKVLGKGTFGKSLKYAFQSANCLCFVMEYANGGDIYFHLKKERRFTEERTKFYGSEIICALGYLHSHGVVYRDLKLENLLLDKDGHIKVADFGLCKEDITYGRTTNTFCGTAEYIAPEILEDNDYGRAVDWWALGVVMYEMIFGHLPFRSNDQEKLCNLILSEQLKFPWSPSEELRSLLRGLLNKSPIQRLGGGPDDYQEIQAAAFFASINWTDLMQKKITPPFRPEVKSETDTQYFDTEFTGESVELTPPEHGMLSSIIEERRFSQFSYQDLGSTMGTPASYIGSSSLGLATH